MLDQDLLSQVQRHLIETPDGGVSWSTLWTQTEVVGYLNQRQQQLLKETHAQIGIAELTETADQKEVTLPDDWLATLAVLRRDENGEWSELALGDTHAVDTGIGDTVASGTPEMFVETEQETLTARLYPAPATAGLLELYYIPQGSVLGADLAGDGETMVLPDEWAVCGVKWGVIADMLGKIGRGRDDSRVQWAQMRYELCRDAMNLIESGWY